jgi:ParB family chromosome partitioning protein
MSQTKAHIERVDPSELEPHELNREIYTNRDITELVEKIDRHGFQSEHELLVTPDNKILSGHRRWRAALELGLKSVPVRRKDVEGDDALLTLLLANQYRDKTPAEKINEGEAWEQIERQKAKERNSKSAGSSPKEVTDTQTGDTRDKVGEKIGTSGVTYERGKKVKEKAEQGDETAQEEWDKLQSGEQSITGAYSEVKQSETTTKDTERDESDTFKNVETWNSAEIRTSIEYKDKDADSVTVCVNGTDYDVPTAFFEAITE